MVSGYADDTVVHCKTEERTKHFLADLKARFESRHLELHPEKTKIVCYQDANREEIHWGSFADLFTR